PTTPWFCSPARMSRIELVLWLVTGILLHGKIGMPRQAGTEWLPTGTDAGYTPLLAHSRPNAAIVLGCARKNVGSFHTLASSSTMLSGEGGPLRVCRRCERSVLCRSPMSGLLTISYSC